MAKNEVQIQKVDLKSMNIVDNQKEKLKELFPEVFSEGKINFDKLKKTLGENIDESQERYEMTWAGKNNCFRIIQEPSLGTLKPVEKESVNWYKTQNLLIEGDNLEVLKLLQKSYNEKIKMIYIDPPYNTGHDFVYKDSFGQQLGEYLKITGQVDREGNALSTNTDSDGRYHSNWMNMMYPRLFLARNLLREDGIIFISIDDNEIDNLKKICNEIFGEENFVAQLTWRRNKLVMKGDKTFKKVLEPILVFSKNKSLLDFHYHFREERSSDFSVISSGYGPKEIIFRPGTLKFRLEEGEIKSKKFEQLELLDKLIIKNFQNANEIRVKAEFKWSQEKIDEKLSDGAYILIKDINKMSPRIYFNNDSAKPLDYLDEAYFIGTNESAKLELKKLGLEEVFSYPKPISLIEFFLNIISDKEAIILDFFAGSGTTAHAVMELNKEDGGNRKFIMVQLPELTDRQTEAYNAGFKNIADISKERIRRVIRNIKEEKKEDLKQKKLEIEEAELDLGFKVFRLDKSNFKIWDSQTKDIQTALNEHINPIKKESSQEDVLYELILKSGLSLTTDVKELKVANKKVFSIEEGTLLICLEKELTNDLIKKVAEMKPARFYCLDEGFKGNDQLKANAVEIFKNVETVDGEKVVFRTV
jgi:adenine-specific DNA-methyltransferase